MSNRVRKGARKVTKENQASLEKGLVKAYRNPNYSIMIVDYKRQHSMTCMCDIFIFIRENLAKMVNKASLDIR